MTQSRPAATSRTARSATPAVEVPDHPLREPASVLDRPIAVGLPGAFAAVCAVTLAVAFLLRFLRLDAYTLSDGEAAWAYDAWSLYTGRPLPGGESLPLTGPLFLVLQSLVYFLFGVTDALARTLPALAGLGIVALCLALRPHVGRAAVVGMLVITAVSPTLVYASRTVDPAILVAFFALLAFVSTLRAGSAHDSRRWGWPALLGVAIAGMLASGPTGVSAILAVSLGFAVGAMSQPGESGNDLRTGLGAILSGSRSLLAVAAGFAGTLLLAFTRLLSDFSALEGILTTFRDWGRLMTTGTSTAPTSFFVYALLLYELLAVIFAIVGMSVEPRVSPGMPATSKVPTALIVWFAAALVLHSLADGRQPEHAVLVALPLVLLGGIGLGRLGERIPWRTLGVSRSGLVPLAMLGLVIGLLAITTLIGRSNDGGAVERGAPSTRVQVAFVVGVVIVPLAVLVGRELLTERGARYAGWSALLALALILGIGTVRSTTELAYDRADTGRELLAQEVPTDGVRAFVDQTLRLSRDLSLTDVSNIDNTGSYGISIAVDPSVQWPYVWYFRDFPELRVTSPAGWEEADMVIAPTPEGMEDGGYVVRSRTVQNRIPAAYRDLDTGEIASIATDTSRWYDGIRYLLFRELPGAVEPRQVAIGYSYRLNNQINPSDGPFDLFQGAAIGPGAGLGQFDGPTGIAVSADGATVYVVDSRNQRIQRFAADGQFLGTWSAETDPRLGLGFSTDTSEGASEIVVGEDGLIHVADTWNHRVVVLDDAGQVVRELGVTGEPANLSNSPDPAPEPGRFYGPRGVAVSDGEIFVTDTGNERVQVFASDGTFLRTFGGYGDAPGKLIEPVGIAIGADGNVWVADSGNARISVFTPDGTPVTQIAMPAWESQVVPRNYLRIGPDGAMYATSPSAGTVEVIRSGQPVTVIPAGDSGEVRRPLGIAIGPDGSFLLTDPELSVVARVVPETPEEPATPGASPVAWSRPKA